MTRTLLLTGASSGLGLAIAVRAAGAGWTVYATMRDLSRRDALDAALAKAGVAAQVLALDVQDQASIDAAVQRVLDDHGHIDALVNNAGVGFVRSTEQARDADIDWVIDVNLRGVIRCTKAVLPAMRKARSGRVVTVSSVGGLVGQPFNEIYCATKFAVEGYMEALATYVTPAFGVHFSVVEPGGISSEFANSALRQIEQTGGMLDDEYLPILKAYIGGAASRRDEAGVFQTSDEVAAVVMDCLDAENPPVRRRTSPWAEDLTHHKTAADPDGTLLRDKVVQWFLPGLTPAK